MTSPLVCKPLLRVLAGQREAIPPLWLMRTQKQLERVRALAAKGRGCFSNADTPGLSTLAARHENGEETRPETRAGVENLRDCLSLRRVGGGRDQLYQLNSDGTWKEALRPPALDEGLEKDRLESVVELQTERIERLETTNRRLIGARRVVAAGAAAGSAIHALTVIMSDPTVTMRRRLQAAENLLAYKTPPDVAESAKLFLASIFTDPEQKFDHRLAATTALRKSEDVPAIERPSPPTPDVDPVKEAEERRATYERRRAHIERQAALDAAELKKELERLGMSVPATSEP